jgi:hypothetical protein
MEIIRNDSRRLLNPKRRLHDSKRQRISTSSIDLERPNSSQSSIDTYNVQDQLPAWSWTPFAQHTSPPKLDFSIHKPNPTKVDLSACHICRRKPTLKKELEDYLDCESCAKRTCAICVRECLGYGSGNFEPLGSRIDSHGDYGQVIVKDEMTHGHKGLVCSRCCMERGSDGEVWCLGCLSNEQKD